MLLILIRSKKKLLLFFWFWCLLVGFHHLIHCSSKVYYRNWHSGGGNNRSWALFWLLIYSSWCLDFEIPLNVLYLIEIEVRLLDIYFRSLSFCPLWLKVYNSNHFKNYILLYELLTSNDACYLEYPLNPSHKKQSPLYKGPLRTEKGCSASTWGCKKGF